MPQPLILVTGSTDGIGLETARELAARGATVLIHGRNPKRVSQAHEAVRAMAKQPPPEPLIADFGSLAGARGLALELARRSLHPTVLINNAGVYLQHFEKSPDDIELTMAINYFAHFALTLSLLSQPESVLERIINVSSGVHMGAKLNLDDIALLRRPFDSYEAYATSKLALVLFTVELARRHPELAINALHPGVISTKLLTEGFGSAGHDTLATGARTPVKLALDPEMRHISGEYFAYERKARMSPLAKDAQLTQRFFEKSAELVRA